MEDISVRTVPEWHFVFDWRMVAKSPLSPLNALLACLPGCCMNNCATSSRSTASISDLQISFLKHWPEPMGSLSFLLLHRPCIHVCGDGKISVAKNSRWQLQSWLNQMRMAPLFLSFNACPRRVINGAQCYCANIEKMPTNTMPEIISSRTS